MSDDWQKGDLALCVESGRMTRAGAVYTVLNVKLPGEVWDGWLNGGDSPTLDFVELPATPGSRSSSKRFRKINPHTPDREDEITIALLTGQPCEVQP